MKNKNLLKLNIFGALLIVTLASNTFADDLLEQYGPAAASYVNETVPPEVLSNVISNDDFDDQRGSGLLKKSDIAAIKQIVIAEPTAAVIMPTTTTTYIGYPIAAPASVAPTETTTNNTNATVYYSQDLNLANFITKNITNVKMQETQAPTYALINATTKEIYITKDKDKKYNPSGLVNLMTAYIATKHLSMNATLKVNGTAVKGLDKDASIAALNAGDTITLKDAIASMFVKGCVDSANVIAENVSGNINDFVTLMNSTAANLGLTNTKFVDPSGIGENESTALDMAIIMARVCENQELVELLKLYQYKLPKVSKRDELILYSRNTQLNKGNSTYNADVVASRMAFTSKAKYCIGSLMQQNGNNYIVVVLKAEGQQFSATRKLFDFAKAVDGITTTTTTTTTTATTN